AAGTEDVPHAAFGDLRIGGGGRDLEDAVLLQHLGGRNRHAGIEMADDELDAVADELVGDRHAFLRVGAVVADEDLDLLPEDAAGSIDVGDGLFGAVLELGAEGRAASGHRPADAKLDLRRGAIRESKAEAERQAERKRLSHRTSSNWNL